MGAPTLKPFLRSHCTSSRVQVWKGFPQRLQACHPALYGCRYLRATRAWFAWDFGPADDAAQVVSGDGAPRRLITRWPSHPIARPDPPTYPPCRGPFYGRAVPARWARALATPSPFCSMLLRLLGFRIVISSCALLLPLSRAPAFTPPVVVGVARISMAEEFKQPVAMKTSDVMVKALENENIEYIFGIPGEENLDLLDSLRNSKIKLVVTRHEQAAGFMAATVGRLTGKAGCCLSTLGPGATNFATAAAYAQLAGFPMMMITGQKPIRKSKQGSFQIVDIVECMRPMTKLTKQIVDGDLVPSLVREAVRVAEEERPGAVHLELPEDIAGTTTESHPFPVYPVRRPIAEDKAIDHAVEMIHSASHPLLLIGAGANRKVTRKMLKEFVDQVHIPFVTTQMGKGVVTEDHPLYLGCCALSAKDYVHVCIEKADLIINVGHDVVEKPPFMMKHNEPPLVIHVNFYTAKVDEVYFPQLEVVGDIANTIWQFKERLKNQPSWDTSFVMEVKKDLDEHLLKGAKEACFPLVPQRVIADLRKQVPHDGIVCLDNGMYKIWFARCYKAYEPNTLLLDNALASMGAGLPSAMAAALLHPDKKVVAVCGDGGFMMNSQELETAIRLKLNLTILVLNDNGYGMIKWKQNLAGFDKFGLNLGNPNFVDYACSYGIKGYRVTNADELTDILHECLYHLTEGVKLVEVPVDYTWANEILDHELPGMFQKRKSEPAAGTEISKALASSAPVALSCSLGDA